MQELENIVFKERQACVANILIDGDASVAENVKNSLLENPNILSVTFQ